MLPGLHGKVIQLNNSILGFTELNEFRLELVEEGSPYAYLQSVEDERIGFVVASPYIFLEEYEFELTDADKELLQLQSPDDAVVLGIITLGEQFHNSSINLLAPIVINAANLTGCQIVLPPQYGYTTKTPVFAKTEQESGESRC